MPATVIAFTNQKGGCGKTTTAVNVAAGLAGAGKSVVLVDTDPQCNATDSFGLDRDALLAAGRFTVADAYMTGRPLAEIALDFGDRFGGRLRLVAGHRGLATVPQRLEADLQAAIAHDGAADLDADDLRNQHRGRLSSALQSLLGEADFLLIDTPPDLGFLMTSALIAADYYMIPVFPSGYDLKGLETLSITAGKVQKRLNARLRLLGVVLGNMDATARLDADILEMLRRNFGEDRVFRTTISRSVKHREAPVYGRTIFEHAPGQPPALQFAELSRELISKVKAEKEAAANV